MAHEVQITRGPSFAVAGAKPISVEEFRAVVEERAEIVAQRGPTMARLGGRPLVFRDGLISAMSPRAAELEVLRAIAQSLGARLFGADGSELGLSHRDEVARIVAAGFAAVDASGLTEAAARDLVAVTDPSLGVELRREALTKCRELSGGAAVAGLAYLLCRSVEARGQPEPALTCAAAHLLQHKPGLVGGLRKAPTKEWVEELEGLAAQVEKSPGPYVLRRCHGCNAKNRLPVFAPAEKQPKCGRCKAMLEALE